MSLTKKVSNGILGLALTGALYTGVTSAKDFVKYRESVARTETMLYLSETPGNKVHPGNITCSKEFEGIAYDNLLTSLGLLGASVAVSGGWFVLRESTKLRQAYNNLPDLVPESSSREVRA